jgi:predicted nucleic acid-binding protein
MILVDTSVIIDFARTADPQLANLFSTLPVGVCGIVRGEFLAGSRSAKDRTQNLAILTQFAQIAIPDTIWDVVGDNYAELRRKGVTVPFPDVVLATVAIFGDFELWTRDANFAHVQRALPALRLFAEPP